MPHADHHSEYLARAVAELTPEGQRRVDELLEGLAAAAGARPWLQRFAAARREEADSGSTDGLDVEPAVMLTAQEFDALEGGFMTIRDTEHLEDVAHWANAVLALLKDERARVGLG